MNISPFTDIPYDDQDAQADFLMVNQLALDRIAQRMYAAGLVYNTYPHADPPGVDQDWMLNIQTELESIFTLLEITGLPDFSSSDWHKEDEFNDWMLSYRQVIERVNAILGIF